MFLYVLGRGMCWFFWAFIKLIKGLNYWNLSIMDRNRVISLLHFVKRKMCNKIYLLVIRNYISLASVTEKYYENNLLPLLYKDFSELFFISVLSSVKKQVKGGNFWYGKKWIEYWRKSYFNCCWNTFFKYKSKWFYRSNAPYWTSFPFRRNNWFCGTYF